jgi:DNA-binding MarR family transcriptional regulator
MKTPRERLEEFYWRPGFLLRRAHQLAVGIFEAECSVPGLTAPQYAALTVLASAKGIDQSAMSRALGFDRVTTLHLMRGLEQRGLIAREPTGDGRRLRLSLTPDGERMLAQADEPVRRAMQRQLAPLSAREQAELLALLRKLCAGLDAQARTPLVPPALIP